MQHTHGYARVPAADQHLDIQLEDLTRAGCSRIFQEKVSGRNAEKVAKVAKALAKGLLVAEIVTLTGVSRAGAKRY